MQGLKKIITDSNSHSEIMAITETKFSMTSIHFHLDIAHGPDSAHLLLTRNSETSKITKKLPLIYTNDLQLHKLLHILDV